MDAWVDEYLMGTKLNGQGEAVLKGYTPLWKILKDYEYDYLYETGQRARRLATTDWKILGVSEFFLNRGASPRGCMGVILRTLERELSNERFSTWDDPEKRRLELLEFQSRFVKKNGKWTYRAPKGQKVPVKPESAPKRTVGDPGSRVVDV